MHVWIVLLALILPPKRDADVPGMSDGDDPIRYRGIERLLAKFEAEDGPVAAHER